LIFFILVTCGASLNSSNPSTKADSTVTQAQTDANSGTTAANLDDDASQWGIFYDGGTATATVQNVSKPSVDGSALEVSLISGQPYVGIHAYRNLAPADTATTFNLTLSFYFPTVTPIQALEFTENKWVNNQRWEWAIQWEHIGSGVTTPVWRLWTGSSWQEISLTQQLAAKKWHKLQLKGNILNGQVHYISFSCDSLSSTLGQTFAPASNSGDKLAAAVQLDGDSQEDPYQLYIDKVNLQWS
jgi:hypothetical protein